MVNLASIPPQIVLAGIIVIYIAIMLIAITSIKKRRTGQTRERDDIRQEKKFRIKFFKSLTEGFQLESIKCLEDILNIYKATPGLSEEDINYRYGLSRYLREYMLALISKDNKIIPDSTTEAEIQEWKKTLDLIISQNDVQMPYSDLPPLERNILNDITVSIKRDDREHVNDKLKELSRLVLARDNELNRIYQKNDGSANVAVVSLIMSVIFGLIALYQYI
ncbi:hypothetical protein F1737_08210 [Methanoplanus sp. FWC-SCC4]|uniref:Uncharacterized protein n=1 Tax=Methanochimaera problematica TaxID=2609417 RepID=A0AA97FCZ1_9EURY|nr:hypothetical protein [Methanoplanus sp. FWC-SCC4]WOF16674.1 hypothetical protein F1737_08210 [Methanoplanus sp. FWC-SCC4]